MLHDEDVIRTHRALADASVEWFAHFARVVFIAWGNL